MTAATALVAGLVCVAFANSFLGQFVYDDISEIGSNPWLQKLWPIWLPMTAGNRMPARFLPYLSFAIDRQLWGMSPVGYHLTNLLIHVVAAVALFDLVRTTLVSPRLAGKYARSAVPLALGVAALWAVHPLQTQAVTYVYQRIESMAGMFCLASLACFARAAATGWQQAYLTACIATCGCAMASKESAIVLPVLILAYDWFFVAERPGEILRRRGLYAALASTWLIIGLQLFAERGRYQEFRDVSHPPLAYALTQPGVILHYLRLAFWPVGQCFDYDWPIATTTRDVILPGLVIAVMIVGTLAGTWLRRPLAWLGVAFFLALAPTSSIMPVAAPAAEHRMYLALAAVVGAIVVGGFALVQQLCGCATVEDNQSRPLWPWAFGAFVALAIAVLVVMTHERNELYADRETLWRDVLQRDPNQYMGHFTLAAIESGRGNLAAAEVHAEQSVRSRPRSRVYAELADDHFRRGEPKTAERLLRRGIELQEEMLPETDNARLTAKVLLAKMLHAEGRDAEAAEICQTIIDALDVVFGCGDATTVNARTLLAHAARSRGDLAAAESLARENLDAAIDELGAADTATQAAAAPLVDALADAGRADDALTVVNDLYERGMKESWGARADLSMISRIRADLLEKSSDMWALREADRMRRGVYEAIRQQPDANREQVLRAAVALGSVRARVAEAEERPEDAEAIATETLAEAIGGLGLSDPATQRAAIALGTLFYQSDRKENAESLFKEYLVDATKERENGDGSLVPPTLVRNALAGLWEQEGRLDEAIALRKKILRDLLERLGPDNPATQQAAEAVKATLAALAGDHPAAPARSD